MIGGCGMIAPMNETELLANLRKGSIEYRYFEHPPVMTSAEAARSLMSAPGISGKNLFLRDKKGERFYLLMTLGSKRVDLRKWGKQEDLGKPGFADAQALTDYLDVGSGAIGPLALINDSQHRIEVYIDRDLWSQQFIRCHPLVNTASLMLTPAALEKYFQMTGHTFNVVNVLSEE
jgi:Ala-tRNA(Pro) deacylase